MINRIAKYTQLYALFLKLKSSSIDSLRNQDFIVLNTEIINKNHILGLVKIKVRFSYYINYLINKSFRLYLHECDNLLLELNKLLSELLLDQKYEQAKHLGTAVHNLPQNILSSSINSDISTTVNLDSYLSEHPNEIISNKWDCLRNYYQNNYICCFCGKPSNIKDMIELTLIINSDDCEQKLFSHKHCLRKKVKRSIMLHPDIEIDLKKIFT